MCSSRIHQKDFCVLMILHYAEFVVSKNQRVVIKDVGSNCTNDDFRLCGL